MAGHSKWASIRRRRDARARPQAAASGARGLEKVRYEGYGPGGAAILVDCLTDDRGRTSAEMRRVFQQHGGSLGARGSVSYLFNTVGLMTYPLGTDQKRLTRVAVKAGAEDVVPSSDGSIEVLADPVEFDGVRAMLIAAGFPPATAEVTERAATATPLSGETAELMMHLLLTLEDLADVRNVYSNVEISNEVVARV